MNYFLLVPTLAVTFVAVQATRLLLAAIYVRRVAVASQQGASALTVSKPVGLTIMQPILSGDPQLKETLQTNVQQLSEQIRFLWLIDERDRCGMETALSLAPLAEVRSATAVLPQGCEQGDHRITILTFPEPPRNSNPKMFKLSFAIRHVRTELAAVLDDDTTIDNHAVAAALNALETADLYTGLPSYRRSETFWGDMVAHFVNNNAVLTYLAPLALLPPLSLNGMFYLFRTELIPKLGGFEAIEDQLCDDYALHQLLQKHRKTIYQGVSRQTISTTVVDRVSYFRLLHRWHVFARMLIRDQAWIVRGLLFLTLVIPSATLLLLLLFACCTAATPASWLILFVTLLVRQAIISASHRLAFGSLLPMNPLLSLWAELLQPFHALGAIGSTSILWRGRNIRLTGNQAFEVGQEGIR